MNVDPKDIKIGDMVVLCGIEQAEGSELFGELVCPTINLWHAPRDLQNNFVAARVGHGITARVLEKVYKKRLDRWYVRVVSEHGYIGWVASVFIVYADDPILSTMELIM